MIPFVYFLIAWLVLVVIFAFLAFITVIMELRYAMQSLATYVITALFLGVTFLILLSMGSYLITVDWSQNIQIMPTGGVDILPDV